MAALGSRHEHIPPNYRRRRVSNYRSIRISESQIPPTPSAIATCPNTRLIAYLIEKKRVYDSKANPNCLLGQRNYRHFVLALRIPGRIKLMGFPCGVVFMTATSGNTYPTATPAVSNTCQRTNLR